MKNPYKHLFFDLDQTLWDHNRNANETLDDLFRQFQLSDLDGLSVTRFQEVFHQVNHGLWHDYHLGKVDKIFIREQRFRMVMEILDTPGFDYCLDMGEEYLKICPSKGYLMPHTIETLDYLKARYPMTIITNGFDEIQGIKLTSSGIDHYFDSVVTSEKAGWLKPHRGIFNFAIKQTDVNKAHCVMIGDNPITDIGGARDAGIDQVFYNSRGHEVQLESTYCIKNLPDLRGLL